MIDQEILTDSKLETLSYEELLERIEALIDCMEDGNLPLEQSLNAFEEGTRLIRAARKRLDSYQKKIDETLNGGEAL